MQARLQDKFIKVFVFPLLCGICLNTIITVSILLIFAYNFLPNKFILNLLQDAENKKIIPMISNVENLLFKQFQMPVNTLLSMKKYYTSLATGEINIEINNIPKMINFIKQYSINNIELLYNYDSSIAYISQNNNKTFLDYSCWYIDKDKTTIEDLSITALQQVYMYTNMNLLSRAHYEVNELNPENSFAQFYAAFVGNNLITTYPVDSLGSDNYVSYEHMSNPSWCRNEQLQVPDHYYFFCRPWFIESLQLYQNYGLEVMISTPYKTVTLHNDIAVCVRFEDPLVNDNSLQNEVLFCTDLAIPDLMSILDQYNNLLTGYFFIMRIKSDKPIYYPNLANKIFSANLVDHEFDLNTEYYVNELQDYNKVLQNFIVNINSTDTFQAAGDFVLNGQNLTYNIFPVFLNLDDNPNITQHIFSIVYISNPESYLSIVKLLQGLLIPRIYLESIIYVLMGGVLFIISRYLIKLIALNIVKPIKQMKKTMVGMNDKNLLKYSDFKESNDGDEFGFITETKIVNSDEESESKEIYEDQDEYADMKSAEIEELFNTLVKLKKVFSFTQKSLTSVDSENNILNHLFAKYTFKEVKNLKGKYLCDSNVGNLALKCKKYDKAIFHLGESFESNINSLDYSLTNLNSEKFSLASKKQKGFKTSSSKLLEIKKDKIKIENLKKRYLESRYPKIIYAFKKYYKNLKNIMKSNSYDEKIKRDMFSSINYHSLSKYQKYLEDYLLLANIMNDNKKKAEALLEINEFYINFKLKPSKVSIFEIHECKDVYGIKENAMTLLNENFLLFDTIIGPLMSNISPQDYLKKYLEMTDISKKESTEVIEIPIYVLIQKANYLKGTFCYYCQNYRMAFNFFNESRKNNVISHAVIARDSVNKIKKIMSIISKNVLSQTKRLSDSHLINKEENGKYDFQVNNLIESNCKINEYISNLNKELAKYKNAPRDIAILINFSYSLSRNDEHEINRNHKKIEQSMAIAEYIIKNFTTANERFTLFAYSSHANPLIHLCYRNVSNFNFIQDQFENFSKKEFYMEFTEKGEPCLLNSLETVNSYIDKKSNQEPREKWIIALTDGISANDATYLESNDIHKTIFEYSELANVVIIEIGRENKLKDIAHRFNFNKSGIIHINRLDKLKNKMRIIGKLNDEVIFIPEKYDNQ